MDLSEPLGLDHVILSSVSVLCCLLCLETYLLLDEQLRYQFLLTHRK